MVKRFIITLNFLQSHSDGERPMYMSMDQSPQASAKRDLKVKENFLVPTMSMATWKTSFHCSLIIAIWALFCCVATTSSNDSFFVRSDEGDLIWFNSSSWYMKAHNWCVINYELPLQGLTDDREFLLRWLWAALTSDGHLDGPLVVTVSDCCLVRPLTTFVVAYSWLIFITHYGSRSVNLCLYNLRWCKQKPFIYQF